MKENKICGVQPFNDFFYKSCFYHQLLSALPCFGIERNNILFNTFFKVKEEFEVKNEVILNEIKLRKNLGYCLIHCNITQKIIIKNIDKGNPIIVGVDSYYLESRSDTYQVLHDPHFILVVGYDLERGLLNIVDHDYRNSYLYEEKTVSFENILYASNMFRRGVFKRKTTSYILKRKTADSNFDIWKNLSIQRVIENKNKAKRNLDRLMEMISFDIEGMKGKASQIILYMQSLKMQYNIWARAKWVIDIPERRDDIAILVSGYSNLHSLFWKLCTQNDYAFVGKKRESLLRKITEIQAREQKIYKYLMGVCH